MQSIKWLRRAGWLGTFGIALATGHAVRADEPAPQEQKAGEAPEEGRPELGKLKAKIAAEGRREEGKRKVIEESDRAREKVMAFRKRASKFWLQMQLAPVPAALDAQLDLKGQGLVVEQVAPGGAAEKAGIKANDVLLSVGDAPVRDLPQVAKLLDEADGKELSLKLLRAGKPITISVTPEKRAEGVISIGPVDIGEIDVKELQGLEKRIREELKRAGVDMKLQFYHPAKTVPQGLNLHTSNAMIYIDSFPDDVSVSVRKQGKNPAEIEVKKGDQSWNLKADELDKLPEELRPYVKSMLGGPQGIRVMGLGHGEHLGIQPGSKNLSAREAVRVEQLEKRTLQTVERRLDEMSKHLHEMRAQIDGLRDNLRERSGDRKRGADRDDDGAEKDPTDREEK